METCELPDLGTEKLTLKEQYKPALDSMRALVTKAFALIPVLRGQKEVGFQ